ncbi:MAG: tetratricopeptide repeat protein [Cyanobacteria bacterium P01_E01_bin.6]
MMRQPFHHEVQLYIQQGNYESAVALSENWVETNPEDISAYWYLGLIYLLSGDELLAESVWMAVILQVPEEDAAQLQIELCDFLDAEAANLASCNRLEETQIVLQKIIEIIPEYVNALFNLGVLNERRGNIGQAIEIFSSLVDKKVSPELIYYHLGYCHRKEAEYEKAVEMLESSIHFDPDFSYAYEELGKCFLHMQDIEKAEYFFHYAISLKPDSFNIYSELSVCSKVKGDLDGAISLLKKAIKYNENFAEAYSNLGSLLYEKEKTEEAIEHLIKALDLEPNLQISHHNLAACYLKQGDSKKAAKHLSQLGTICFKQGAQDEALAYYKSAIELDSSSPEIYCRLAVASYAKDRYQDAISLLLQGIKIDPRHVDFYFYFARFMEKENNFEEARKYTNLGLEISPSDFGLNVLLALLDRREGNTQRAIQQLEKLVNLTPTSERDSNLLIQAFFELGKLYDKDNCPYLAMESFRKGNNLQASSYQDTQVRKYRFLNYIHKTGNVFSEEIYEQRLPLLVHNNQESFCSREPVFLVGFPRSGTTLLNEILDAHPNIQVLHEKPVLTPLFKAISADLIYKPDAVLHLDSDDIQKMRRLYFETVDEYITLHSNSVLVDKQPFNLANAGIIHQIFPNAKFILALRHPYDVCLSCLMQHFGNNDGLSSFYTLEDTAVLYNKIMTLWEQLRTVLNLDVFEIRYEQLVENLEESVQPMLKFIGVDWDDSIANYREYAKTQKGKIHTPSYSQIVQPLYKDATYRWKRYKKHLEPVIPLLAPHVQRLGYPTD